MSSSLNHFRNAASVDASKGHGPYSFIPMKNYRYGIFSYVLHQPHIATLQPPLDQQRPQRHPARMRRARPVPFLKKAAAPLRGHTEGSRR